ncbi:MAG: hypothetical protein IJC15_05045 [Clostridia bacterium]|nr:hypothetical protein [Clostridia bacterium]
MQNQNHPRLSRAAVQQKYSVARRNLFLMIMLTVVNLILLVFNSGTMMLFSATVPYYTIVVGIVSENSAVLTVCIVLTAVILATYVLCWLMSQKHYGWMIAALVMFILDTLAMVGLYLLFRDFSGIMDALVHIWVLYYLIMGVRSGHRLRSVSEDDWAEVLLAQDGEAASSFEPYPADMSVKARVLLESEVFGHHICYRRVKQVNELVIDGQVYDAVMMGLETAHALNAQIDGKLIQVGLDENGFSYLSANGEVITRKRRLW